MVVVQAKSKLDDFISQRSALEDYVNELVEWMGIKEKELEAVGSVQEARVRFGAKRDSIFAAFLQQCEFHASFSRYRSSCQSCKLSRVRA